MQQAVRHLAEGLAGIRTGVPGPSFLATVRVAVQGNSVPLGRLAAIRPQGDRLLVTPFDPALVPAVVRALVEGRLSAYALDPRTACVTVPPLSGEQRAAMARHVKKLGEEAKVAVRMIRQDARKAIAAKGRGSERAVQADTDAAIVEIDRLVKAKLDELGA